NRDIPRQPVLEFGPLPQGSRVPSLLDLPHKIFTRSGRSAILLALRILGLRAGDRVLVPTYHCPTMISPIVKLGGVPVFYPITARGEPDLRYIESIDGSRHIAMLAAHLFGLPQDLSSVADFCHRH